MKAKKWAVAAVAAFMLAPVAGWAQSDALLDNYNLYATNYSQGKFQEALPFALELIELHKSEFGDNHPTSAVLYANVAELHIEIGHLGLAEPLMVEAVKSAERSLGQGHRTTAVLVGKLAKLYRWQGRYDEAETLYLRTIKIKEQEFSPNHMAVAVSLSDLAQLYYLEARFAEAEPLYRRTLGILVEIERVHPLTSAVLFNNVAELFTAQGRSFGAVMPKLASRLEADDVAEGSPATEVATAEVTEEVADAVEVAAVEPEIVQDEVAVGEFVEETVDTAVTKPEEVEIVVEAPEPEEVPETVVAAVEIIVEPEEVGIVVVVPESEQASETAIAAEEVIAEPEVAQSAVQEVPEVKTVVAALEPEPEVENIPRVSDLSETDAARDDESEWAKIDAALDIPQETDASASDMVPQGEAAEMRFDLAGVIVNGSSIYRGYIGTEVSVADLYSISHAITRRYAATTAVVPSQSIQSGIATIRIEESLIGNIILVD